MYILIINMCIKCKYVVNMVSAPGQPAETADASQVKHQVRLIISRVQGSKSPEIST